MNTISSRTPDGIPGKCPICMQEVVLQPSDPLADCPCPCCGTLIWPVPGSSELAAVFVMADELSSEQRKRVVELLAEGTDGDSLDHVERIMELEDILETSIPDDEVDKFKSIDDFWQWWTRR